jgi:hypothetical protein
VSSPLALRIGSVAFEIDANDGLLSALRARYGAFESEGPHRSGVRIDADSKDVITDPRAPLRLFSAELRELEDGHMNITGDFHAMYDPASGRGCLESGEGTIGVDMLLRLSLSLRALEEDWVLLHGAAVELRSGGWVLLVGDSGEGKSTAARAFASRCDELVLARGTDDAAEAASTPYWHGKPGSAECEAIVCLEKSATPAVEILRGSDAARTVLRHAIRFSSRPERAARLLANVGALASRVRLLRARALTGERFVEWLGAQLEHRGLPMCPGAEVPA